MRLRVNANDTLLLLRCSLLLAAFLGPPGIAAVRSTNAEGGEGSLASTAKQLLDDVGRYQLEKQMDLGRLSSQHLGSMRDPDSDEGKLRVPEAKNNELGRSMWRIDVEELQQRDMALKKAIVAASNRLSKGAELTYLASGHFWTTFRALDATTGKGVVVKLFFVHEDGRHWFLTTSPGKGGGRSWSRTATEAEKQAMLLEEKQCYRLQELADKARIENHAAFRHIIKCLETRVSDGTNPAFVVYEYAGEVLKDNWFPPIGHEKSAAIRVSTARLATMQLLSVIDLTTREGIVHHDLKFEHVAFQEDDKNMPRIMVKVTGWDASSDADSREINGCTGGTEGYIPPEQCWDAKVPHAYDMFAIGVMLVDWLRPYTLSDDADWKALVDKNYANFGEHDIDHLQKKALKNGYMFPNQDAETVKGLLGPSFLRPTPRKAAFSLYPLWFRRLAGHWVNTEHTRTYRIKRMDEGPPIADAFDAFLPKYELEVLKRNRSKGKVIFTDLDCMPDGRGSDEQTGDFSCCSLRLNYARDLFVTPCRLDVEVCGLPKKGGESEPDIAFKETRGFGYWGCTPKGMVKEQTTFVLSN